jgi:hypothetical protein
MLDIRKIKILLHRGLKADVIWDLFMILAALVNLSLITFDAAYLWARPWYLKHVPEAVDFYDPFLGIEPHRETQAYLQLAGKFFAVNNQAADPGSTEELLLQDKVRQLREELIRRSAEMIEKNPFERAGLTGSLEAIKKNLRKWKAGQDGTAYSLDISARGAWQEYWTRASDRGSQLEPFYRSQIQPYLEKNYYRHYDVNGRFVNQFWKLDLPFLLLFIAELLIRWIVSIRRRQYMAWFLFPFYNWYDFAALVPFHSLRFLRLFRIASIYIRLARSQLTTVGDDFISRWIRQYTNIIKEEVADMVTIRVLSEMQDEIRGGATVEIFTDVLEQFRDRIRDLVMEGLRASLEKGPIKHNIRVVMERALTESAREAATLKPIPGFLKETITRDIGLAVYDSILESLTVHVQPGSKQDMEEVIDYFIDEAIRNARSSELIELSETISLEILENMKKKVAVKKWAAHFQDDGHAEGPRQDDEPESP